MTSQHKAKETVSISVGTITVVGTNETFWKLGFLDRGDHGVVFNGTGDNWLKLVVDVGEENEKVYLYVLRPELLLASWPKPKTIKEIRLVQCLSVWLNLSLAWKQFRMSND